MGRVQKPFFRNQDPASIDLLCSGRRFAERIDTFYRSHAGNLHRIGRLLTHVLSAKKALDEGINCNRESKMLCRAKEKNLQLRRSTGEYHWNTFP